MKLSPIKIKAIKLVAFSPNQMGTQSGWAWDDNGKLPDGDQLMLPYSDIDKFDGMCVADGFVVNNYTGLDCVEKQYRNFCGFRSRKEAYTFDNDTALYLRRELYRAKLKPELESIEKIKLVHLRYGHRTNELARGLDLSCVDGRLYLIPLKDFRGDKNDVWIDVVDGYKVKYCGDLAGSFSSDDYCGYPDDGVAYTLSEDLAREIAFESFLETHLEERYH